MQGNRESYHHGDLRHALLDVGLRLARGGGPEAVTLREATREVGVTVNAAYRHFDGLDGYLSELAKLAQARLAERIDVAADGARGEALLRAVGLGYIAFALDEPGWFATAFSVPADLGESASPDAAGPSGRSPFVLLGDALQDLVGEGRLAPERTQLAVASCWSAVHGFAYLALSGPLQELDRAALDPLAAGVVDNAIRGILAS